MDADTTPQAEATYASPEDMPTREQVATDLGWTPESEGAIQRALNAAAQGGPGVQGWATGSGLTGTWPDPAKAGEALADLAAQGRVILPEAGLGLPYKPQPTVTLDPFLARLTRDLADLEDVAAEQRDDQGYVAAPVEDRIAATRTILGHALTEAAMAALEA